MTMDNQKHESIISSEIQYSADKIRCLPFVRNVLDALPLIVLILNSERRMVYANQATLNMAGQTDSKGLLGLRPGDIMKCTHAEKAENGCGTATHCRVCGALRAVTDSQASHLKVTRQAVVTTETANGPMAHDLSVSASPFEVDGTTYMLVSITDISHEKRRRVLERVFFHDILNTAGNIQNLSDMSASADEETSKEYQELIHIASRQLVEEIKTQSILLKAENNELVPTIMPINAKELVAHILEIFDGQEQLRDIVIEVDVSDIILATDETIFARVLSSMVKNALEASTPGNTVTIETDEEDDHVLFRVHNSGYIPGEMQLHMFDRSFSTKGEDRGLGLYSIKLLTEKYLGGRVVFESQEDRGTTFTVILPQPEKENPVRSNG